MNKKTLNCIALIITIAYNFNFVFGQIAYQRTDSIKVKVSGNWLKNPWTGGLNACQFSSIDLNQDEKKDLFVFDRSTNKINTFLNNGTPNNIDYKHEPEYQTKFPVLHDWALLVDYNCDDKEDIFTYHIGNIAVYKNISNLTEGLKFELVTDNLSSTYSTGYYNLYISSIDIPAITDIDNDDDIDIITYAPGGITMRYYQNQSKELYGTCDLNFMLNTSCWGDYAEDGDFDSLSLNVICSGELAPGGEMGSRHSGSASLCLDADGDGDKELIIGDASYNNMIMLTNGGTPSNANMTSYDANFPSNTTPVNMIVFPAAYSLDVNNDGLNDILISTSSPYASHNFTSVWYYKNIGTVSNVVYEFQQNNFLQDDMIEVGAGAYPVFFDYNNDGLKDLLIGNNSYFNEPSGKISLYKNIGTITEPKFELITRNYNNLSSTYIMSMAPSFGDLDGDTDSDMIIGDYDGKLHYFENIANIGDSANFVLSQAEYFGIDVGQFASPQIVDVNRDGKKDLLIGSRNGKLSYCENTGTNTNPQFSSIISNFGGVNVSEIGQVTGYSCPFLYDKNGSYELLVGSKNGHLYYYTGIDGNLSGNFNLVSSTYSEIYEGGQSSITGADLNNDGSLDLVVGNYAGGVGFYKGISLISTSINNESIANNLTFDLFPNPTSNTLTIIFNDEIGTNNKKIVISNLLGQEIMTQSCLENKVCVNINTLEPGLYNCQVFHSSSNGNITSTGIKKFIIQK